MAGLDSEDANKIADVTSMKTNPSYSLPANLISGIECPQIKVNSRDKAKIERAVEAACNEMLVRSGGKGFPILVAPLASTSSVMAAVQRVVGASALLYTSNGSEKNEATEAEVEKWVSRWKKGNETRLLITDDRITRGWEAKELLVIGELSTENLVMRTCGFCFFIKLE